MAARRLPTIIPSLTQKESLEVTRIHSVAGLLPQETGLISYAPFRMPHHSASNEGIIGGGKCLKPGEVSLAHRGILFLDEAPEFKKSLLQSLREPIEQEQVTIVRAGQSIRFPSSLQLIMAANPCPCGNLGRNEQVCVCSIHEVHRYWRKMGGALLDRIDIRVPIKPVNCNQLMGDSDESSKVIKERVLRVVEIQAQRFKGFCFWRNAKIPPGLIHKFCYIDQESMTILGKAFNKLSLSSRAYHSILRVSRTIADIDGSASIKKNHVLEAIQHRRYGDDNYFWECA